MPSYLNDYKKMSSVSYLDEKFKNKIKKPNHPIIGVYRSSGSADGSYVFLGPRGGHYYLNSSNVPTYLDENKRLSVNYIDNYEEMDTA